ncbi:energy transducer TonB [Olivibacter domesticus]|uniref:TonB protein C-terminal n=1 Tax=Olivibacter domesticus TaxID=407022 RepID=A0A1H7S9C4_OLID1|nr:energy transducer TonB [Olivibacter domesticus]SEL69083.1 TonB protein C-terminal [Olivibacter domesticus]
MNIFTSRLLAVTGLTFFLSLFAQPILAQNQIVTYLNKNKYIVAEKDSAVYIRILTPDGKPEAPYSLTEQYKTGEIYRKGTARFSHDRMTLIGLVTTYQPDGKKISEEYYKEGAQEGSCRYYYKNGNLKSEILVSEQVKSGNLKMGAPSRKLLSFYDSLGTQLVKNGNGYVHEVNDDGDSEEGEYKDGYKEGNWKGTFLKKKYRYTERYEQCRLLEGTSIDSTGKEVHYSKVEERPEYPGGMQNLYRFIGMNYRYPRQAYQQGASGAVILSFIVDTLGKPAEITILQDAGHGTGEEGVRVLRGSPKWVPGKLRGIPVRVSHSVPIHLNLQ